MERHGVEHMREIGRKGFETTVARHWNGDRQGYRDYLGLKRHEAQIESFVEREQNRRLAAGEQIVCHELPVLSGPDDDYLPF